MTKKEKAEGTDRQPYRKPLLEQVQLVTEEAVLQSCKSPGSGPGPTTQNCKQPGNQPCLNQTS
jgi:hypothetical protein